MFISLTVDIRLVLLWYFILSTIFINDKKYLKIKEEVSSQNLGLGSLILRLVVGGIFFVHGLKKFQDGIGNSVVFFEGNGLPGILAYPVSIIEFVGGILIFLGIGTRIIAATFSVIMVGAMVSVNIKSGFTGGFEFTLALFAMSLYLVLSSNQFLAVDNFFMNKEQESKNL
jgi:putative oxidoreductase